MKVFSLKSFVLALACLLLLAAPSQLVLAQQAAVAPAATTLPKPPTELEQRQEAFQIVWQTVNDLFYDPKFGGIDWAAVRTRYEPRVGQVKSNVEFHEMLQQMLNELHQSHFVVVPREAIPKIRVSPEADDQEQPGGKEVPLAEDPLEHINYKLADRMLTGIGIELRVLNGSAVVTRVQEGSTAARAGLRPGFVIKKVGRRSMDSLISEFEKHPLWGSIIHAELPTILVAAFINGDAASSVRLSYLDGRNRMRMAEIKREHLRGEMSAPIGNLPSLYTEFEAKRLPGGVGYIRFNAFVPPLMEKLCGALRSMKDAPGIVLDLRGNQGGLLGMVGGLAGLLETNRSFLGTMRTRDSALSLVALPQASPYAKPLVILVDGSTQSAGEMFASGLQETDRALVVGEKTAGNTLPSAIKKLPTGAIFQYGFADYETHHGNRLEGVGVIPDVTVSLTRKNLLRGSDPQLAAALRRLREKIAGTDKPVELIADVQSTAPARSTPPTIVTIMDPPPPPPPMARPVVVENKNADGPSAKSILEKYLAATGGKEAFDKLKNRVSIGTVELTALGLKGTVEVVEDSTNRSSMIINAPGLGVLQKTFDGKRAWLQDPLQGFIRFTGLGLEIAQDTAIFNRQARFKESLQSAVFMGKEKLAGNDVYVVRMRFDKWYFDAESGLLVRKDHTYYGDYREVDGVKLPFKIREEVFSGAAAVYQLTEIKHNVKIDETKFSEYPSCFTKP